MAIGYIPDDENIRDQPLRVKERVITYAAADLIQTAKGGGLRGSSLKNAISNLMICTAVSNLVVNVLCLLGLSCHHTNLAVSSDKAVNTIETEEAEISSTVRERLQRFADHPFIHLCIRVRSNAEAQHIQGLFETKYLAEAAAESSTNNQNSEECDLAELFAID